MNPTPDISPWRSAALLGIAALLATSLLAGIHAATRERIAERGRALALQRLAAVLPPSLYENDPLSDTIAVVDPRLGPGPQRVHIARLAGTVTAMAITATAPDGYAGPIDLIVGVDPDGKVLGVRVLDHAETPGLGDPIETRRSDWILGFDGRGLGDPPAERWTVRSDGGDFDAFTGATITPRAVTHAVRRVLDFHASERQRLQNQPPDGSDRARSAPLSRHRQGLEAQPSPPSVQQPQLTPAAWPMRSRGWHTVAQIMRSSRRGPGPARPSVSSGLRSGQTLSDRQPQPMQPSS